MVILAPLEVYFNKIRVHREEMMGVLDGVIIRFPQLLGWVRD